MFRERRRETETDRQRETHTHRDRQTEKVGSSKDKLDLLKDACSDLTTGVEETPLPCQLTKSQSDSIPKIQKE